MVAMSNGAHFHLPRFLGRPVIQKASDDERNPIEQARLARHSHDARGDYHERPLQVATKHYETEAATALLARLTTNNTTGLLQPGISVVLGEPGMGKSSELLHWSGHLARQRLRDPAHQPLPVFLRCSSVEAAHNEMLAGQEQFWRGWSNSPNPQPSALAAKLLPPLLRSYSQRVVYLLDGLDELRPEAEASFLQYLKVLGSQATVIVSCRTRVWEARLRQSCSAAGWPAVQPVTLMGLKPDEQLKFLQQMPACVAKGQAWIEKLHRDMRQYPQLRELATNPLLLSLMGQVMASNDQLEFPQSRSAFYQAAIAHIFDRKKDQVTRTQREDIDAAEQDFMQFKQRLLDQGLSEAACHAVLEPILKHIKSVNDTTAHRQRLLDNSGDRFLVQLAGRLLTRKSTDTQQRFNVEFGLDDVLSAGKALDLSRSESEELCDMLLDYNGVGLLTRAGHQKYAFIHLTFQEYFAAKFLFEQGKGNDEHKRIKLVVERYWTNIDFDEMLSLLLGMCSEEGRRAFDDVLLRFTKSPLGEEDRNYLLDIGRSPLKLALYLHWSAGVEPSKLIHEVTLICSIVRRMAVAMYARTPVVLLQQLVNDDDWVRSSVAGNPSTPPETLQILAEDKDLRSSVAENPSTPPETLQILAEDKDLRSSVAENPSTPPETLQILAEDKDAWVRICVARNLSTPLETLQQLADDGDALPHRGVARNPNTPLETLQQLAGDGDERVRRDVAKNPSTPQEILQMLAGDGDGDVRSSVAQNPNTPPETLQILAEDHTWLLARSAVASNPNIPPETLHQLAGDSNEDMRIAVAGNPNTPPEMLHKLAEDKEVWVRMAVARNPNTPMGTLQQLIDKTLVNDYFKLMFDEWMGLADDHMRSAVAQNPNLILELV
jgi:hypothetical protein